MGREKKTMTSPLDEHVERELALLDLPEQTKVNMRIILSLYSAYGYFGRTEHEVPEKIMSLVKFKNLSPLTDDPEEWEQMQAGLWKNKRNGRAFSQNGGKTFYYLSGQACFENPWPQHVSYPHTPTVSDVQE
jgi:hypothetical protein